MGIIKLGSRNFDQSTIITHPSRSYSSGSSASSGITALGIAGSVFPFVDRSHSIKGAEVLLNTYAYWGGDHSDPMTLQEIVDGLIRESSQVTIEKGGEVTSRKLTQAETLIDFVRAVPQSTRSLQEKHITRRTQGTPQAAIADSTTTAGNRAYQDAYAFRFVENTLSSFYMSTFPGVGMDYRNYHSLNFFTASNARSDTALIFPCRYNVCTCRVWGRASLD